VDRAPFALAVPDDSDRARAWREPSRAARPADLDRTPTAVRSFECETWEPMFRSRVVLALVSALYVAFGPGWQDVMRALD
jgi:hypothetical protein